MYYLCIMQVYTVKISNQTFLILIKTPLTYSPAGVIKPGSVGEDGKIKEMDIAEQIAKVKLPESKGSSDEEEDEEEDDLKLDSNHFYPRKKAT